jgi:branched-subunit amino acid transport protein
MITDQTQLWTVIIGLAVGTFLLRFVFLGVVGDRQMPDWLMRHLRYTAVAILPALIAPAVVWPSATGGALDTPRLIAAFVTLIAGVLTKNLFAAILCGAAALALGLNLLG